MHRRAIPLSFLFALLLSHPCLHLPNAELRAEDRKGIEDKDGEALRFSDDVVPKTLVFTLEIPGDILYYNGDILEEAQERFKEIDDTYFPYFENDEIHLPKKYDVDKKYSKKDARTLRLALKAAYQYADINKAFQDGYSLMPGFVDGMGIHLINIEYVFSDEVDPRKPEFLTYFKNRETGQFQIVQIGYSHPAHADKKRYELFEAQEAQGHFWHGRSVQPQCVRVESYIINAVYDGSCDEKKDYPFVPKWMMHVSVVLYNDEGMFSDRMPLVNYLSLTGTTYSFYGKKIGN